MFKLDELPDNLRKFPDASCIQFIKAGSEKKLTFADIDRASEELVCRLEQAGICGNSIIGIMLGNCIDWVIWDIAAIKMGFVIQAFPDDFDASSPESVMRRNHLALLVTQRFENLFDPGIDTGSIGNLHGTVARQLSGDVLTLVYSSGTSGANKGLVISRAGTEFVVDRFINDYSISANDQSLVFLPMYNFQQRLTTYACITAGADIVITEFSQALYSTKSFPPSFIIAPPVFYETVMRLSRATGNSASRVLGGGLRFAITGMAPISPELVEAFNTQGVQLLEAYGSTETGMISWNTPSHHKHGSVGRPLVNEHIVMGEGGEVVISRPTPLSLCYFDTDDQIARAVFLDDGSIDVGDYGEFDDDGFLYLLGRRNDVIVTPSGKKVHPSVIEHEARSQLYLSDIAVVYDTHNKEIILVVGEDSGTGAASGPAIQAKLNQSLPSYSRINRIIFADEKINGNPAYMTKNMKLSRTRVLDKYCPSIEVAQ